MKTGTWMELNANLKALNLSTMARNLEVAVRQARESGLAYDDFLLELTAAELQARADNSLLFSNSSFKARVCALFVSCSDKLFSPERFSSSPSDTACGSSEGFCL